MAKRNPHDGRCSVCKAPVRAFEGVVEASDARPSASGRSASSGEPSAGCRNRSPGPNNPLAYAEVLFVLISAGWLIVAVVGLAICRLGGLSDDSHVEALAEWIAANCITEDRSPPAEGGAERLPIDARFRTYRAAG
jgi:hypothetical protein